MTIWRKLIGHRVAADRGSIGCRARFHGQQWDYHSGVLSTVGLSGCPQVPPLAATQFASDDVIPIKQIAATDTAIADYPPVGVSYEVCGEIADWERLSLAEQTTALMENPRYGADLETAPLQELFDQFWNESLITFTTYGLSARTEPIDLSGVWTGIEAMGGLL